MTCIFSVFNSFSIRFCGPVNVFGGDSLPDTTLNERLSPKKWTVILAPDPDDVLW